MTSKLTRVVVAVDRREESMNALRWSLANLNLPSDSDSTSSFTVRHVQSPPSISAGLNPGSIPFGGPSAVPAIAAAIEAPQRRITEAVIQRALEICGECTVPIKTQVEIGNPKEKICETVENLNADLLVMGSHAFGPIKSGGDNAIDIPIMHGLEGCSWRVSAITVQTMHGALSSSLREKGIADILDKLGCGHALRLRSELLLQRHSLCSGVLIEVVPPVTKVVGVLADRPALAQCFMAI